MRYFVRISFLGRSFYGTQKQKNKITIQGVFEEALTRLYTAPIKVTICSRLDKGVSALDYALTYDDNENLNISESKIFKYLSDISKDIVIRDVRIVGDDFSCRYDCLYKVYLYTIQNEIKTPIFNDFTFMPDKPLDVDILKSGLEMFRGEHDFREFATLEEKDKNTVLTIDDVSLRERDGLIYIRFKGKSFLTYQVRFMVGSLIRLARGKISLKTIEKLLTGEKIKYPRYKIDSNGLLLEKIIYKFDINNL